MDHSSADERGMSPEAERPTEGAAGAGGGAAEKFSLPTIPSELPVLPVRNVVVFPGRWFH